MLALWRLTPGNVCQPPRSRAPLFCSIITYLPTSLIIILRTCRVTRLVQVHLCTVAYIIFLSTIYLRSANGDGKSCASHAATVVLPHLYP